MKVKIWTVNQMPMIREMVIDGRLPEFVADEVSRIVSILDEYYDAKRNVENDDGGYLLVYTDYIEDKAEIQAFLDKYHMNLDDAELDDTLCIRDGVTWKSVLYLVTNDYGVTLIYPYRSNVIKKIFMKYELTFCNVILPKNFSVAIETVGIQKTENIAKKRLLFSFLLSSF